MDDKNMIKRNQIIILLAAFYIISISFGAESERANEKYAFIKKIIFKVKIEIEVLRIKFDLLYRYFNLGRFISKYYNEEKIKDFSYKEDYFLLNNEINLKKRYIKKLKIKSKI